jgi:hypothetical protein
VRCLVLVDCVEHAARSPGGMNCRSPDRTRRPSSKRIAGAMRAGGVSTTPRSPQIGCADIGNQWSTRWIDRRRDRKRSRKVRTCENSLTEFPPQPQCKLACSDAHRWILRFLPGIPYIFESLPVKPRQITLQRKVDPCSSQCWQYGDQDMAAAKSFINSCLRDV